MAEEESQSRKRKAEKVESEKFNEDKQDEKKESRGVCTANIQEVGVADHDEISCSSKKPKLESLNDTTSDIVDDISCNTDILVKHVRENDGLNVLYYPNFIKSPNKYFKELSNQLDGYYDSSPNVVKVFGKVHNIPRRQTAFGDPGTSYSFSGVTVPANPWIPLILKLKDVVECTANEKFNFVLVNYYRNGHDHMGEHRDDERELCPSSSIASLSFGQERDFVFCHKDARGRSAKRKDIPQLKLCLSNGSLLLMCEPTNKYWYHSLPIRKSVKGARINLTFRRIKVKE